MSLPKAAVPLPIAAAPANDNMPETITPDDGRFFAALGLVCLGVLVLAAYALMTGPDDVMAMLKS